MSHNATATLEAAPVISCEEHARVAAPLSRKDYVKSEIIDGLRIGMRALFVLGGIALLYAVASGAAATGPHSADTSRLAAMFGIAWCVFCVPTVVYCAVKKSLPASLMVSASSMVVLGLTVGIVGL